MEDRDVLQRLCQDSMLTLYILFAINERTAGYEV